MTFPSFEYILISRSCRCFLGVCDNFFNFLWKFSVADCLPNKKLLAALVLDVVDELPLLLMVKSVFPFFVIAESESPVGTATLVGP